jgi:trimethylamine:corrinoid methyltransferase-like protein
MFNQERVDEVRGTIGNEATDMLFKVHADALWILENLGVGCKEPDMVEAFKRYEDSGEAITYDDRIYVTESLVNKCLETAPGVDDFFVPLSSFFVGGTAPYIYDDEKGEGGVFPTAEYARRIYEIVERMPMIAGTGRGIKLKDEVEQMTLMAETTRKPIYFAVTNDAALERAKEIYEMRKNIMIVFCLTRPPLEVNENFSEHFVKVVKAGLPVFDSAMPMAGISAPFCYNGVLAMTQAEVLFGLCVSQLLNPGITFIHAGFPTIADPRIEYNPNYGLLSHFLLNILMSRLNYMMDLPSFQSAGATHEEHPTEKAYQDAVNAQALCMKYGFHMIRHPFAFLRYLIDFSIAKLEKAAKRAETVTPHDAPEVQMPAYDERGRESIERIGLGMYMEDPLTTANIGKLFVD